jgi:hypothetical protein
MMVLALTILIGLQKQDLDKPDLSSARKHAILVDREVPTIHAAIRRLPSGYKFGFHVSMSYIFGFPSLCLCRTGLSCQRLLYSQNQVIPSVSGSALLPSD